MDTLIVMVRTLESDPGLRQWFLDLEEINVSTRIQAIQKMAGTMRQNQEDPAIVNAVVSLAHPDVFLAVVEILKGR